MKDFTKARKELGVALRILRNRKDLTQEVVAMLAGVSARQVRQLELGKHSGGIETFLMICDGLGINPFELLTLAWEKEYHQYVDTHSKIQTKCKAVPESEQGKVANEIKSLRADKKIRAETKTKCLYGGDNGAIIKIKLSDTA